MSSCVVLSDATVHDILIKLSRSEILEFLNKVADSLRDYSLAEERSYQPEPAVVKRDGRKNLFRLFTSQTGVGVKIIVDPSQALLTSQNEPTNEAERAERNRLTGLHGILALCDQNGFPIGFLNAEEITGYRTSLSAMILYMRRSRTANIVVFGAGKQALWHVRLALALRGEDIKRITVVNRSAERTASLIAQIERENEERWKAKVEFESVLAEDSKKLKIVLGEADVVFCTTPSKAQLFPADYLTGQKEGCYVSAIGSWSADMLELDPEMLRIAAQRNGDSGIVVVDDREECMKSAGEVVQSKLGEHQIAELGEILDLVTKPTTELQAKTVRCLESGFVVYKSVGVSLTDLSAGQALLALAKKSGQGLNVPDF
ncbi:hypothetical protein H2198_004102 [Neophaeococcomyces mojaviensis]|uniref:Uncharacterized protein n=1 Tax=Neophaeococcomyces mojaviensis TaxID=3383035 RepID=A0ACC3A9M1_9EURO|nr:hypothetical protein H2198_004102 [Knufia sp. JES_112]